MRRDEVVAALRQAQRDRREIARLQGKLAAFEKAWRTLSREEQEVLQVLVMDRRRGNAERLCEKYNIEPATVYRWRNKALQKLAERF
jgi:FixJ family two-component response regulator